MKKLEKLNEKRLVKSKLNFFIGGTLALAELDTTLIHTQCTDSGKGVKDCEDSGGHDKDK